MDGFKNATFSFYVDKSFKITTTSNSELFEMMTSMTQNIKWRFKFDKQHIQIGDDSDGYTIMGIYTKKNGEQILFHIEETEITLDVEKIE